MATAHELARKLLAGADYEVILAVGGGRGGRVKTVSSMSGLRDDMDDVVTRPVIVLEPEPHVWEIKSHC